ncbi:site-2 protease family protein [Chitinophaga sp. 30R24]|uniref:site-2 protease family protein n=1 Tax=Chitinophaga sp. 30R24 TaxID=3248838 RepID=UPI003B908E9A
MLITTLHIAPYSTTRWVVHTGTGKNVLINDSTYQLIQLLQEACSWEQAYAGFQEAFKVKLSFDEFNTLVTTKIGPLGLLTDVAESPSGMKDYLPMRFSLLRAELVTVMAAPLKILFFRNLFFVCFSLLLLYNLYFLFFVMKEWWALKGVNWWSFFALAGGAMILHEVGHIAAARKFGVKTGGIGIGFYFIMPVMYADISDIWSVSRWKRIIINCAGVYVELLLTAILGIYWWYSKNATVQLAFAVILIRTCMQLRPFFRSDGYWILSDLLQIPNLLPESRRLLKKIGEKKSLSGKWRYQWELSSKERWMLGYVISNTTAMVIYFLYVTAHYGVALLQFPAALLIFLKSALTSRFEWPGWQPGNVFIIIYYLVLIYYILKILKLLASRFLGKRAG